MIASLQEHSLLDFAVLYIFCVVCTLFGLVQSVLHEQWPTPWLKEGLVLSFPVFIVIALALMLFARVSGPLDED